MEIRDGNILSDTSITIRGEENVRMLSAFMRERTGTANQKIGRVLKSITKWDEAGRKILSPRGSILIVRPPLNMLDGFTRTDSGAPVFFELPEFKLADPAMAFRSDGKRSLNHFIEKAQGDITNVLDIRLLSMVFWIGVFHTIETAEEASDA